MSCPHGCFCYGCVFDGVLMGLKERVLKRDLNLVIEGELWTLWGVMYVNNAVMIEENEEMLGLVGSFFLWKSMDDASVNATKSNVVERESNADCTGKINRGNF